MARDQRKRATRHAVRERSRAAYQAIILEAAEHVFTARGFAGTRMSDVARQAGVATGTLYNYFDNKGAVFQSLMELRCREFLAQIEATYETEADPLERIRALVRFATSYMDEHAGTYAIFVELGGMSEASIGRIGGDELVEQYTDYVDVFERAIKAAVRAKRLKAGLPKPADLAAMLTGAVNGVARAWIASGRSTSLASKADLIVDIFLEGIAR